MIKAHGKLKTGIIYFLHYNHLGKKKNRIPTKDIFFYSTAGGAWFHAVGSLWWKS